MSLQELSYTATVGPEKCNTAEAQDKDFKMAFLDILFIPLKRIGINPSMKSVSTQTNSGMKKTAQEVEAEMEQWKKTQTEIRLEMKNLEIRTKTSEVSLSTECKRWRKESYLLKTK